MKKQTTLTENSTNFKKLVTIINTGVPTRFHSDIKEAITYMKTKHRGQKRLSGESFYYHPLNVAAIVSEMGLDTTSVIAALLHSVPYQENDPDKVLLEISDLFGNDTAELISTVYSYSEAIHTNSDPELIIQYIIRSSNDLRPIFIKIADRVHHARTIDSLTPKEKTKKARELLEIYAPLVEYVNQYSIKKELEEIAFRILKPAEYEKLEKKLKRIVNEAEMNKNQIIAFLEKDGELATGVKPSVYGRVKGYYSIYNKMENRRKMDVGDILDLFAFTSVFQNEEQCYKFTKYLLKNCDPLLEYYDDYIKYPKENGYKAIHIPLKIEELTHIPIEVHINTEKMHHFNTYGPASHLAYKYNRPDKKHENAKYYWVKQIHQNLYDYFSYEHRSKSCPIPNDAFSNKIFVFTPDKTLVDLPIGSTAVDFAYKIHSNLGNKASYALINSSKQDLSTMLKNGDHIEIIIDDKKELPDREWLKFVRTKKARDEIENEYKRYLLGKDVDFTHVL